ncbi:hypothetical protein RSOLAG1IB_12468 [Rhizoctonia solani AG-1 IB]|uniref:Uncharacterized protein n=1 Tax=Thanatephorus cucumeris (strain AG1-IB / isolate 7/3/14) TaxID=1108050 RepID=A0A0B7FZ79_THACB|nr:hypothetical protein RSOLAG1IB_12468 [Rhizoctonia solani AG-1 IB]
MDPKSHAVIDGPFDRDPDKSVWTTYYVDPKCKWWVDVKSLAVTKPFVVILEDFVKIVGPDAELKIIARADKPEFHEAGVYIANTNEVFFTSNRMATPHGSDHPCPIFGNLSKIGQDVQGSYRWQTLNHPDSRFVLPNGGTISI